MRVESRRVFRWPDFIMFFALSLLIIALGFDFFRYWLTLDAWRNQPVALFFLTFMIVSTLGFRIVSWCLLPFMRRPVHQQPDSTLRVAAITTFVPGSESIDMLRISVVGLAGMNYPHDTWVLDEGDSRDVESLCEELGVRHFSRKHMRGYQAEDGAFKSRTKYGNVNAWLDAVGFDNYDFIAAFDPDHIPRPVFLDRVLGYFRDPGVGYVQAAQVYYNQAASFIARGAAEETYDYYSNLEMASYRFGYPIVTGCHNTHRVSALREVGGFSCHDADDLLITLNYRSRGWQGVYVPEVLAEGLTPVDWQGYLKQQRRWARSVMDIKFRIFPKFSANLPAPTQAFSILHGLSYLTEGLLPLLSLLLLAYLLVLPGATIMGQLLVEPFLAFVIALGISEFFRQKFFLQPGKEFGLHWRAGILRFAKWPQILLATFDVARRKSVTYMLTGKEQRVQKGKVIMWPHLVSAVLLGLAWAWGAAIHGESDKWVVVWTILAVIGCIGIFASQFLRFPAPFDHDLALGSASYQHVSASLDEVGNVTLLRIPEKVGARLPDTSHDLTALEACQYAAQKSTHHHQPSP